MTAPSVDHGPVIATLERTSERGVPHDSTASMSSAPAAGDRGALLSLLGDHLLRFAEEIRPALAHAVSPLPETVHHLLGAGGKLVRPTLMFLSARATGAPLALAQPLAQAGELIHLATLLHDDVIDDAQLRRGLPAPRIVWSNTVSVLGGDYAITCAFDLIERSGSAETLREGVATIRELCEGEILQLRQRELFPRWSRDDYFAVVQRKTASLFRWCARAGARIAGTAEEIAALGRFGGSMGICFQIVDDILDLASSKEDAGKDTLADLREGKCTLPMIYALEREPALAELFSAAADPENSCPDEQVAEIQAALERTGAIAAARADAQAFALEGRGALAALRPTDARDALDSVAAAIVARAEPGAGMKRLG